LLTTRGNPTALVQSPRMKRARSPGSDVDQADSNKKAATEETLTTDGEAGLPQVEAPAAAATVTISGEPAMTLEDEMAENLRGKSKVEEATVPESTTEIKDEPLEHSSPNSGEKGTLAVRASVWVRGRCTKYFPLLLSSYRV
jgi:hypothetical protein